MTDIGIWLRKEFEIGLLVFGSLFQSVTWLYGLDWYMTDKRA
jgi:hypothetical protein